MAAVQAAGPLPMMQTGVERLVVVVAVVVAAAEAAATAAALGRLGAFANRESASEARSGFSGLPVQEEEEDEKWGGVTAAAAAAAARPDLFKTVLWRKARIIVVAVVCWGRERGRSVNGRVILGLTSCVSGY